MSGERLRKMVSEATSGPWFYDSYAGIHSRALPYDENSDEPAPQIATVHTGYDGSPRHVTPADARLIALAPDAIALLADMADHLGWLSDGASHELLLRLDALCGDER